MFDLIKLVKSTNQYEEYAVNNFLFSTSVVFPHRVIPIS